MDYRYSKTGKPAFTLIEIAVVLLGFSLLSTAMAARAAFTLIEICLVLLVITILGGIVLNKMAQDTRRTKQAQLQRQLNNVEDALRKFALQNRRLPCPANFTRLRDIHANFGVEASLPGSCTTSGSPDSIAANYIDGGIAFGVIPTRTLANFGLTDNDMFDPYGGAIMYAVSLVATGEDALLTYPPTSEPGNMKVRDAGGTNSYRTTSAVAVILSFGPDRHGAPQISGQRMAIGATNLDTLQNCHCDANGNPVGTGIDNTFVLQVAKTDASNLTNNFDDVGRYFLWAQFRTKEVSPSPSPSPFPDHIPDTPPSDSPPDTISDGDPNPGPDPNPVPDPGGGGGGDGGDGAPPPPPPPR